MYIYMYIYVYIYIYKSYDIPIISGSIPTQSD